MAQRCRGLSPRPARPPPTQPRARTAPPGPGADRARASSARKAVDACAATTPGARPAANGRPGRGRSRWPGAAAGPGPRGAARRPAPVRRA
ncbi:hypothetical protein G6F55_013880 [Rhizopus delemar]|nr:hypothetical protein G6F55_013880 [Rhizopus delemar]